MYPYHRPDLLLRKETYEYADCVGDAYYQSWKQSREEAITRLRTQTTPNWELESEGPSAILVRLSEIKELIVSGEIEEAKRVIQPLVKQFEITRKLGLIPKDELSFETCSAHQILKHYVLFSEILLDLAEISSLQHLSTALKVNDALTSIDFSSVTRSDKDTLVTVIRREISIVEQLRP